MINVIEIHMEGAEHLEHIAKLKYVTTDQAGSRIATSQPKIVTRAGMYEFVRDNPDQAYAISQADNVFAFLEHVNGHVQYVRTAPDSTTKDNLLSLPRF